jgi:hypothetical protein
MAGELCSVYARGIDFDRKEDQSNRYLKIQLVTNYLVYEGVKKDGLRFGSV